MSKKNRKILAETELPGLNDLLPTRFGLVKWEECDPESEVPIRLGLTLATLIKAECVLKCDHLAQLREDEDEVVKYHTTDLMRHLWVNVFMQSLEQLAQVESHLRLAMSNSVKWEDQIGHQEQAYKILLQVMGKMRGKTT